MKKKCTVVILLILISMNLLAGCGSTEEKSAKKSKTILTYMVPKYGNDHYVGSEYVERINKTGTNLQIEVQTCSEEQYYTALKAKLATGEGPDLFFVQPDYAGSNGIASLAEGGYLAPVDELSSVKTLKETDGGEDSLLKYDGHVYSISSGRMALGVIYNKDIFRDLGIEVPEYWEGFLNCCKAAAKDNIRPVMIGGKDAQTLQYGIYQIAANQLYPKNPDFDRELRAGVSKFTDKGTWDKVLGMYLSLYDKGYIGKDVMQVGSSEAMRRFREGGAAMMFASASEADSFVRDENGTFGFFFLPANDKGKKTYCSMAEVGGVSIYSESENIDVCMQIMDEIFWEAAAARTLKAQEETAEVFPMIEDAYVHKEYFPLCNQGWNNEVELVMERMIGEYISGSALDISDITSDMQKELEK